MANAIFFLQMFLSIITIIQTFTVQKVERKTLFLFVSGHFLSCMTKPSF
ncbi:unnamed protein product [Ixodes persulcatus]